jgi:hypothetical protein
LHDTQEFMDTDPARDPPTWDGGGILEAIIKGQLDDENMGQEEHVDVSKVECYGAMYESPGGTWKT